MAANTPRRLLPVVLVTLLLILTSAYYVASLKSDLPGPRQIVETVTDKLSPAKPTQEDAQKANPDPEPEPAKEASGSKSPETSVTIETGPTYKYSDEATAESEKGIDEVGRKMHVRPSNPSDKGTAVEGCVYPILIHTSPDKHCTGALALYASIVRNVLMQQAELTGKVCVHFTYVDPEVKTIEEMYQWTARPNPFMKVPDCAALDTTLEYNDVVPVQWQALTKITKPDAMTLDKPTWVAALNKVHSWAFDLYPRAIYLDADSFVLQDLHKIFLDSSPTIDVAAAPDQYSSCHDRNRMNGGMVLLRPSRYLHIVMLELLYDVSNSCLSGVWSQSEQELLNCFCGYNYGDKPRTWVPRPEFQCSILPIYDSVWPKNYGCSDVNVYPMRSIHFTAVNRKPWDVSEKMLKGRFDLEFWKCLRDTSRSGKVAGLKDCVIPPLETTRKIGNFEVDPVRRAAV